MNANLQRGAANTVNTTLLREVPGVFASHMFLCRSWWIQMDPDGSSISRYRECWWVLMGVFGTAQRLLFLDHLWHLRPSKSWQALALATSTTSAGSLCFHMFSLSPERIALKKSRSVRKCAGETWVSSWEEAWQMSRLDDCFACEWTEWTVFRGPGQEEWAWGCSQVQLPGTKGNRTMRAEIPWNPPTLWFYQVYPSTLTAKLRVRGKPWGIRGLADKLWIHRCRDPRIRVHSLKPFAANSQRVKRVKQRAQRAPTLPVLPVLPVQMMLHRQPMPQPKSRASPACQASFEMLASKPWDMNLVEKSWSV